MSANLISHPRRLPEVFTRPPRRDSPIHSTQTLEPEPFSERLVLSPCCQSFIRQSSDSGNDNWLSRVIIKQTSDIVFINSSITQLIITKSRDAVHFLNNLLLLLSSKDSTLSFHALSENPRWPGSKHATLSLQTKYIETFFINSNYAKINTFMYKAIKH